MPRLEDFRLRPIEERDLETVLGWRNSERIRSHMYTDHVISKEEHLTWFQRIQKEPVPVFLILEHQEKPIGIVNITQIDKRNNKCFWGFYLGEPEAPPGSGTLLGYFGLNYIFHVLKIRKLCAEAFVFNSASIRFHRKFGFVEEGRFVKHIWKNGQFEDIVSFALFDEDWTKYKSRVEKSFLNGEEPE